VTDAKPTSPRTRATITPRAIAAEVLVRVERDAAFAAAVLDAELSRAVQLDGRDRGLATELVYGTLRVQPWLEEQIASFTPKGIKSLDPRVRAQMSVAAYQLFFLTRVPAFAAVNECVDAVRAVSGPKVAAFANAVLRKVSARAAAVAGEADARADAAIRASAAPWLREALGRALGAPNVDAFLSSGLGAPPLGLRVDAGTRAEWIARLASAAPGATFEPGAVSPLAILARGAGRPQSLPGWSEGTLSIQEEGSQLVALALGARPGDAVLDACAGRGNKTALLAREVGPSGAVDACDLHASKLATLGRELGRSGLAVRATYAVDWAVGEGDVTAEYDRVLIDAPCSGTGTLRRRPELQTRRSSENLAELSALQRAIVTRAAGRVREGGRLVFAVCSVLREEAEDVVEAVLAARPELRLAPFDAEAARAIAGDAPTFRILPHVHGTDGYFVASFLRRAVTTG
jgi:16S rRNA (cytosine967-C5)-methyltransferase